ncbi:MAG: biotin--[acetyl-CoA-carboxylase] ligase [Verrucomicrobia bacterium]|nr:MAG: biotin--[acetyl-CoA-carboxylase] ligase [Verrucomicrobiota bacterium]
MFPAEMLDRLVADELQAHFPCATIGRQIIVLEQTGSTNDAILRVATANSKEGLVLFAEHQTAGRGQRDNRWESAAGKGLWFSILLQPKIQINNSGRLTIWAIETISDSIQTEFSLAPRIKLPNDVQVRGRKVAGVLVEMRAQEKAPHLAIVGIGINVNQSPEDFPPELQSKAISLAMALRRPIDRQKFAVALLRNLDLAYRERFASAGL